MTNGSVVAANILQPLIDVFEELLTLLHDLTSSWGLAIIGLTLVIRTLLLPLAVVQYKSMKGMAALSPKIKELQAKYPDDPQKLMAEQRKMMSESGVNPAAGCLPLLLQAPVFISLFYMLRKDLKFDICGIPLDTPDLVNQTCSNWPPVPGYPQGAEKFLFIPDLTAKGTGAVLVVLLVLYVGSQLLSTLLMPSTVQGMQRNIFYALPFLFVPFIISFPTGLLVYWITTNLYTVVQQVSLRRIFGAPGVTTGDDPLSLVEGAIVEVAEMRGNVGPTERPKKRKRTGKRR